jgi:tetratricopeptide (TPR) repeat protein
MAHLRRVDDDGVEFQSHVDGEQRRFTAERAVEIQWALGADVAMALDHVIEGSASHAAAAEAHYRQALAARPGDSTAPFNLGVALEDLGRTDAALEAYEEAVSLDAGNADAHYNAACLAERIGRPAAALRHWQSYRKLIRG